VEKAVIGKRELLEEILAAVAAKGHVLLEDYPGLAKTLIAKSFAAALGLEFKRIQFTPDLLPGDITGSVIFDREKNEFRMEQGPIFANIVLADEINRASPKTQAALLEAMQEGQVTLGGETLPLPDPFVVIATQNPIEYEGTFPLPEAQLDRFLIKTSVGYPSPEEEQQILQDRRERKQDQFSLEQVADAERLTELTDRIEEVHVEPDLEHYIVALVQQTRKDKRTTVGASPRGSLALLKLARARAALQGRSFVIPDDVKRFVQPALSHRLILQPDLWMKRSAVNEILTSILNTVPVPVVEEE
jgi:MoxR-like ATPase